MSSPTEVVLVDAVRTPFGKRGGYLSGAHALDVLGGVYRSLFDRSGIDPGLVGQVIGGCVNQVGMQSMNIARGAWLAAGLPMQVPAVTIDTQCGSSQQATNMAYSAVASGVVDCVVVGGVELMSQVPMGAAVPREPNVGKPVNKSYWAHQEFTSQFEGAERIAEKWGITREETDAFGKLSQDRLAAAWSESRFERQIVPAASVEVQPKTDEGVRPTSLEGLAGLRPSGRPDGVHTAATSSQIADGAAAALVMTRRRAEELGLDPLAVIVDVALVGCDPVLMLEGPIPATRQLLERNHLGIDEVDVVEINEAFASVVLAWQRETGADLARVNPNGGAIAHGHPLGATGVSLVGKAAYELARVGGEYALVTMCCGGGLGTGTLLRRVR